MKFINALSYFSSLIQFTNFTSFNVTHTRPCNARFYLLIKIIIIIKSFIHNEKADKIPLGMFISPYMLICNKYLKIECK